jgi:peptide-methionine (S)-S-oxide reductase
MELVTLSQPELDTTDEQRRIAEDTIADVKASGLWPGKVVTEVAPAAALGSRARASRLLGAHPERLHVYFVRPNWELPHRASVQS